MNNLCNIFVDGSYFSESKVGYIGGYLSDQDNNIIFCFFDKIENKISNSILCETLAIKKGIEFALELGFNDIAIFSDCTNAISEIYKNKYQVNNNNKLLTQINDMISLFDNFEINYLSSEKNILPDILTRYANSYFSRKNINNNIHKDIVKKMKKDLISFTKTNLDFLDLKEVKYSNKEKFKYKKLLSLYKVAKVAQKIQFNKKIMNKV